MARGEAGASRRQLGHNKHGPDIKIISINVQPGRGRPGPVRPVRTQHIWSIEGQGRVQAREWRVDPEYGQAKSRIGFQGKVRSKRMLRFH